MAGLTWEQVQQIYNTQAGWDFNKIDPTALQRSQTNKDHQRTKGQESP